MLYSTQKDPANPFNLSKLELSKFLGICVLMSVVKIPDTRRYWSKVVGNSLIMETLPVNKFEKIRSFLHFNDNSKMIPKTHPDHDRVFKIRYYPKKSTA